MMTVNINRLDHSSGDVNLRTTSGTIVPKKCIAGLAL